MRFYPLALLFSCTGQDTVERNPSVELTSSPCILYRGGDFGTARSLLLAINTDQDPSYEEAFLITGYHGANLAYLDSSPLVQAATVHYVEADLAPERNYFTPFSQTRVFSVEEKEHLEYMCTTFSF